MLACISVWELFLFLFEIYVQGSFISFSEGLRLRKARCLSQRHLLSFYWI